MRCSRPLGRVSVLLLLVTALGADEPASRPAPEGWQICATVSSSGEITFGVAWMPSEELTSYTEGVNQFQTLGMPFVTSSEMFGFLLLSENPALLERLDLDRLLSMETSMGMQLVYVVYLDGRIRIGTTRGLPVP